MVGFMIWIREKWVAWDEGAGWPRGATHGEPQHEAFDRWLAREER